MHIEELRWVRSEDGWIEIGATARLRDVERHPDVIATASGGLIEAIRETGPWLIRNQATLAGNICNASPSADSAPMLLALDAEVRLADGSSLPLDRFFAGPHRTVLKGRLVTSVRVQPRKRRGYFHKLSRSKSDVAQVNLAVTARVEAGVFRDVRIALGSVAPTPMRAVKTEALLEGRRPEGDLAAEASRLVREEISPIDDWRATAAYRTHAAGVLVQRAILALGDDSKVFRFPRLERS